VSDTYCLAGRARPGPCPRPAAWPDTFLARIEALALIQTLNSVDGTVRYNRPINRNGGNTGSYEQMHTSSISSFFHHCRNLIAVSRLAWRLRRHPYRHRQATTGSERLAAGANRRAIKANPITSKTPVIMLTGKASTEEELRALESGFSDFIPKPVQPLRVVSRVRHVLDMTKKYRR